MIELMTRSLRISAVPTLLVAACLVGGVLLATGFPRIDSENVNVGTVELTDLDCVPVQVAGDPPRSTCLPASVSPVPEATHDCIAVWASPITDLAGNPVVREEETGDVVDVEVGCVDATLGVGGPVQVETVTLPVAHPNVLTMVSSAQSISENIVATPYSTAIPETGHYATPAGTSTTQSDLSQFDPICSWLCSIPDTTATPEASETPAILETVTPTETSDATITAVPSNATAVPVPLHNTAIPYFSPSGSSGQTKVVPGDGLTSSGGGATDGTLQSILPSGTDSLNTRIIVGPGIVSGFPVSTSGGSTPVRTTDEPEKVPYHWVFAMGPFKPTEIKSGRHASFLCNQHAAANGHTVGDWLAVLDDEEDFRFDIKVKYDVYNVACDLNGPAGSCKKPNLPKKENQVAYGFDRLFWGPHLLPIRDVLGSPIHVATGGNSTAFTGLTGGAQEIRNCSSWSSDSEEDTTYFGDVTSKDYWDAVWGTEGTPTRSCNSSGYIYCIDQQDQKSLLRLTYRSIAGLTGSPGTFAPLKVTIKNPDLSEVVFDLKQNSLRSLPVQAGATVTTTLSVPLPSDPIERDIVKAVARLPYCLTRLNGRGTERMYRLMRNDGTLGDDEFENLSVPNKTVTEAGGVMTITCNLIIPPGSVSYVGAEIVPQDDVVITISENDVIEEDESASIFTRKEPLVDDGTGKLVPVTTTALTDRQKLIMTAFAEVLNAKRTMVSARVSPQVFKASELKPGQFSVSCPTNYRHISAQEMQLAGINDPNQGPISSIGLPPGVTAPPSPGTKVYAIALAALSMRFGEDWVFNQLWHDMQRASGARGASVSGSGTVAVDNHISFVVAEGNMQQEASWMRGVSQFPTWSYDGDRVASIDPYVICFYVGNNGTYTKANLEATFQRYLSEKPDLTKLKNPTVCKDALDGLFANSGTAVPVNSVPAFKEQWENFYYNLVINEWDGECRRDGADLLPLNKILLVYHKPAGAAQSEVRVDAFVNGLEGLTDYLRDGVISPDTWLRGRFTQHFFQTVQTSWGREGQEQANFIGVALSNLATPSLDYNNVARGLRGPLDCEKEKNNLGPHVYYYCKYHMVFGLMPVVGFFHDAMLLIGDLATGSKIDGTPPTFAKDFALTAFQGIPVFGQLMKVGKGIHGTYRAARWEGARDMVTKLESIAAKGLSATKAELDEAAELYVGIVTRAKMPTAAEQLPEEVTKAQVAYGKLMRESSERLDETTLFSAGPTFLTNGPSSAGGVALNFNAQGLLPDDTIKALKAAGVYVTPVANSKAPGSFLYQVLPETKNYYGRLANELEAQGYRLLFSSGTGGVLRMSTNEVVVPFVTNFSLAQATTAAEAYLIIAVRHEMLHVAVRKQLMKERSNKIVAFFANLRIFQKDRPFARELGPYGSNVGLEEIRAFGVNVIGLLRFASMKHVAQEERRRAVAMAARSLEQIGNLLFTMRAAVRAEAAKTPIILDAITWKSADAALKASVGTRFKTIEAIFKENPSMVVAVTDGLILPIKYGKSMALTPNVVADAQRKFSRWLYIVEGKISQMGAEFGKIAPKYSTAKPTHPLTAFGRTESTAPSGNRIHVMDNRGVAALVEAQRNLRHMMRILGTN